jgi:hypothetical protein
MAPDLRHELGDQPVELGVVGLAPLQVLHQALGLGVVLQLTVGDRVPVGHVLTDRRVEVRLLGDRVPDQLDGDLVRVLLAFGVPRGQLFDLAEKLLHLAMVGLEFLDDVSAVSHDALLSACPGRPSAAGRSEGASEAPSCPVSTY